VEYSLRRWVRWWVFSCHGDFLSTRQVSVGKARLGLLGVYDRYFASTRKVSVLIHPNRPILMENVQRPGDSGSEASCRRDLVPWQDHIGLGSHCLYRWSFCRIPRHRTRSRRHGASLAESHGIFIRSTRMGPLGGVRSDTFRVLAKYWS